MGHDDDDGPRKCSLNSVLVFLGALLCGTICSLTSKALLDIKAIGMSGELESFKYPLFQTTTMFLGMTAGLFFHFLVLYFQIPFPGYFHKAKKGYSQVAGAEFDDLVVEPEMKPLPLSMYFVLIIPAVFDLVATCLCMYGLLFVSVSVYQMLRGSAIVFVAIFKQTVLKDVLKRFQWVGISLNVVSIVLVGLTAMLIEKSNAAATAAAGAAAGDEPTEAGSGSAIIGVMLILCGALVQSLQYVFEEKVMVSSEEDPSATPTPPLLLIGMEGLWGFLLCITVLYPLAYYLPGSDHGCFENPYNMMTMIGNSSDIQHTFWLYFLAVFFYNALACLVTFMLDSIWHSILDNFRPATVWGSDLFIFYCVTQGSFGESWNHPYSWLQLFGMLILIVGTMIYNAPNPGSIKLTGGLLSCFVDCSEEYEEVLQAVPFGEDPQKDCHENVLVPSNPTPFYGTMSPFMGTANRRMVMSPGTPQGPSRGATPIGVRSTVYRGEERKEYVMVVHTPTSSVTASPFIRVAVRGRENSMSGNTLNLLSGAGRARGASVGTYGST